MKQAMRKRKERNLGAGGFLGSTPNHTPQSSGGLKKYWGVRVIGFPLDPPGGNFFRGCSLDNCGQVVYVEGLV